jgi:uncharacterized membrane protein YphA (DoxX/SURF4 family)
MMKKMMMWNCRNTGLLIIRLGAGGIFLANGIMKITHMPMVIGFFQSMHMGPFWAWLVTLVELIGGVALLVGFGTMFVGIPLAIIMLVAIFRVKLAGGLGAYEGEVVLLSAVLGIMMTGPGKYALGKAHCGCKGGCMHDGVCGCGCKDGKCNCENCTDKNCGCGTCAVKGVETKAEENK